MSKITANVSKIKTLRSNNATNYNNFVSEMQSISLEFLKNEKHMQEQLLLINSQISQMETLIEACEVHEVDVNEILAAINNA